MLTEKIQLKQYCRRYTADSDYIRKLRWIRYDELLEMIEGSREGLSGSLVSGVSHSRPDDVDRPRGYVRTHGAEMTSTMTSTMTSGDFQTDSDPPTLQIRDQRRGRGRDSSPLQGRTPSPDTSVISSECEVITAQLTTTRLSENCCCCCHGDAGARCDSRM